jgi:hypothetical protein
MKKNMFFILTGFIFWTVSAHADIAQIKAYKETYPDAKPKCIECHVDKMPKKDDGAHENNDYGKSVIKAAKAAGLDKPTADTYKTVGPFPNAN